MRILLTNDDGIYAAGIAAINKTLKEIGEVVVVAPEAERSGASHSITWAHPLRLRKTYIENKFFGYAVSGSPADCVKMAAMEIMKEPPELVVSGINLGANTGIHVLYSGTVAASIEGSILGIPSVAVSIDVSRYVDLGYAAIIARDVIKQIIKGIRLTRQYTHGFEESVDRRKDPGGNTYYWLVGGSEITVEEEGTDVQSIRDGYISITPLCYDLTDYNLLKSLDTWDWKGVEEDVCKFKGVTK